MFYFLKETHFQVKVYRYYIERIELDSSCTLNALFQAPDLIGFIQLDGTADIVKAENGGSIEGVTVRGGNLYLKVA